ncbi:SDR family NAD(P)-dependent oxidoreductase [Nocardia seriolae]|uniref:Very-long-chain 3-oxoacyl-CoA reductase n=1 Tax=Nocardia seriolae TaxID=37332 RepID=A0ABC8AQE3_9NOCA|nr:SDR family NAD(P)-dependent oxidoreductase [Nocardia seriolae]APA96368.1 Very-long-chain 3-oxoacyl-CoA reductase [Nocardia seriolae]OJF78765.1 short-chain dehydrogenase [Nocardia seriolae]PSK30804.1 KR domain-containing protein [Nocardia seriolae]QOW31011.1 SDR family NAD(P)-dependent oxidoreductase [Nocardia seriolae]QUN15055.1 SDR family NAD(P)-dependent oxidoreductase [Nocardia seriolae]
MWPIDELVFALGGKRRSQDARAVVTGAGSGIGRAFALELAARGGEVVCADIDKDRADETVRLIEQRYGRRAHAFFCDVSRREDVESLAMHAELLFGGAPTLVINNAGVGIGGKPVGDIGFRDWEWALGINLWGVVYGCEVFAPQLRAAGRGGIINVASAAGFAAAPGMAAYNVSKAAVVSLSETMAAELAGSGLAVTALCPTFVKTNVVADGRISSGSSRLAAGLMKVSGFSPERVARTTLDAHDRGALYVLPQLDARVVWHLKRHFPALYTQALGVLNRVLPQEDSATPDKTDLMTGV